MYICADEPDSEAGRYNHPECEFLAETRQRGMVALCLSCGSSYLTNLMVKG
jgi:hypothetical protein